MFGVESDGEPQFQKLVEAKWRSTLLKKRSGILGCLNLICIYVPSNLLGSQLFWQIGFLNNFGLQKKRVEKR